MTTTQPESPTTELDVTWKLRAACKDVVETEMFYTPGQYKKAKGFCHRCPVKADCLDYALVTEQYGIWGGMSEKERDKRYPEYIREAMREDLGL